MSARVVYEDDLVQLWHGDFRDQLDMLAEVGADAVITDPPYGETSLEWDTWPRGWVSEAARIAPALWCFGSFRMFIDNLSDFGDWKYSHEIVWEKTWGSGVTTDRFRRVHEFAALWYRGDWADLRHEVPRVESTVPFRGKRNSPRSIEHQSGYKDRVEWVDDGTRMQQSVIKVRNEFRRSVHPTQKPLGIVAPLIEYSVPRGGLVVDLFAGSATTAVAARQAGRRCIAFEAREDYALAAMQRLAQQGFDLEDIA